MTDSFYKSLIEVMPIGYAYHKVICDENGKPYDFEYLEVNPAFERHNGIEASEVVGKRRSSLLPAMEEDEFDWMKEIGEIALSGGMRQYERYINFFGRYQRVHLFSNEKYYFATIFSQISDAELELVKSEQKYKMIIDNMVDNIWTMDLGFRFTYISPSIQKGLGYTAEEAIRFNIEDIVTPASFEEAICIMQQQIKFEEDGILRADPERSWKVELELLTKNRARVFTESTIRFLRNRDGKAIGFVGLSRDVTAQKLAQEASKRSEEHLRLILDSAAEGIFGVDLTGNCTYCNASGLRLLGYRSESELIGQNMHELVHCSDHEGTSHLKENCRLLSTIKKGQKVFVKGDFFWTAEGKKLLVEFFSHPQYQDNVLVGAVVTFMDITKRENTERELRESERSKSILLSNLPGMAYRCKYNKDWTMQFVSEGCFELTGYEASSLLNGEDLSFNQLIDPEYREEVWNKCTRAINEKSHFKIEYPIITAAGEKKWVYEQGQGIYGEDGTIEALEGMIIDITERKKREQEIEYLLYHDLLTDLYNRKFLERALEQMDSEEYMPLSIILGDINGVKMINDAFGNAEGDAYIAETAKLLKSCCRDRDILGRMDGDEFMILLPQTDDETAYGIQKDIQKACAEYNINLSMTQEDIVQISISLGYSTKYSVSEDNKKLGKTAESYMNKRKLLEQKSSHSAILSSIKATMAERCLETGEHAERMVSLSRIIGKKLRLSVTQLDELALLATLHDIGKVAVDDRILNKPGRLNEEEWEEMKKHPEIGYRIAMSSPELVPIAEYILTHHERWDRKGYPQGLFGEQIPLLSRIIAVADAFDAMTEDRPYRKAIPKEEAAAEIKKEAGKQFDPAVAELFYELISAKP